MRRRPRRSTRRTCNEGTELEGQVSGEDRGEGERMTRAEEIVVVAVVVAGTVARLMYQARVAGLRKRRVR